MLNRRFLRIKVMQALYAYFQHDNADPKQFEKELFRSLDKIYDLYLTLLALFADLHHVSLLVIEENRNKRLPEKEDLTPNMRFADNLLLKAISQNTELKRMLEKKKISWQGDFDVVRKIFSHVRHSKPYKLYMQGQGNDLKGDKEFMIALVTDVLSHYETLLSYLEDKNIYWADDSFVAFNSLIRTFEDFNGEFRLHPLLKDEQDDLEFMSELFTKTILYRQQFEELIDKHTRNWEIERIASMDMLLMEMALAEILHLPNIPVKASLNEYIDISKQYSTPNSKVFVNGVLDKVIAELRRENRIEKTGRGLKES
jgi:N utilization substance protein B